MERTYNTTIVTLVDGTEVEFETAVNYMIDEIREDVHNDIAPCTEQEFINEYSNRYFEKFGEKFIFN